MIKKQEFKKLDAMINATCQKWQVPGLVLAVEQEGTLVYHHLHGYRDVTEKRPVTLNTVFGTASITKSITALAVLIAQDLGFLKVEDRIIKCLPELKRLSTPSIHDVTVHHLLTHTSGFPGMSALFGARAESIRRDPDWPITNGYSPHPYDVTPIQTVEKMIAVMVKEDPTFIAQPGLLFNYSNEGYAFLQEILERVTDESYLNFVQTHILSPLDMGHSVFRTEELEGLSEVTELYAFKQEGENKTVIHSPAWWDVGSIYSNGSLKSTAQDLLSYLSFYENNGLIEGGRLLSEIAFKQMITRSVSLPTGYGYGYGLHTDSHSETPILSHSGGIKGVSADFIVAPEKRLSIVALSNIAGINVAQLTTAALNACMGLPLSTPTFHYKKRKSETITLTPYVGDYYSEEGDAVTVYIEAEQLLVQEEDFNAILEPYKEDGFVDLSGTKAFCFLRNEQNQVHGLFLGVRFLQKKSQTSL